MFKPLPVYLGLRYACCFSTERFISFVSASAFLGLTLGIAILITVCSVMNGFNQTIRAQLSAHTQHIQLIPNHQFTHNWQPTIKKLQAFPEIKDVAPFVKLQGVLNHQDQMLPAYLMGIQSKDFEHFHLHPEKKLSPFSIVLDSSTQLALMARAQDKITLILPQYSTSMFGMMPRLKRFKLSNMHFTPTHYQATTAYIRLEDAQKLAEKPKQINGLSVNVYHLGAVRHIADKIQNVLGSQWLVYDWTQKFSAFFKAIAMEKTMMTLVLSLLICMAAFSLLSSLVMMVNDKKSEIAVLRTMGLSKRGIMMIFITQGMVIGMLACCCGVLLGWFLSHHIAAITHFLEMILGQKLVSADVYWVDTLPSQFLISDSLRVIVITLILCFIATLYPGYKAANLSPTQVLRAGE